jgi:NADH dehydrogenase
MATRTVATVFGGSGFIGRYVVKRLAAAGHVVRVAVRNTNSALFLKPMGAVGQVVPLYAPITSKADVARATEGATYVVSLVGILAERRPGDFRRVQAEGPGRIAEAAAAAGVSRLVHVSAIGADPASPSQYASSKGLGEQALLAAFPSATILRPSLVFGPEDQFFNRFAGMARLLPFLPVFSGTTRFQPVYVGDVADAVMAALGRPEAAGKIYELGGPEVFTFEALMAWIVAEIRRPRRLVHVPMRLARFQARIMERLPGKPLTRDQLLLLARDNVASATLPGLADLGINAAPIELIVPQYLQRFRPGGGRTQTFGAEVPDRS